MDLILFIHSSNDENFCCFHFGVIMNNTSINICGHTFSFHLGDIYLRVILLDYVITLLNSLKNCQSVFRSVCGSANKESTCNAGDLGLIPRLGRSPGEGNGYPLYYSGLENSIDCIVHGVAKSRTQLSNFHVHCNILYFHPNYESSNFSASST